MNSIDTIADAIGKNIRIVGEGLDVTGTLTAITADTYILTAEIGHHRIDLTPNTQWEEA